MSDDLLDRARAEAEKRQPTKYRRLEGSLFGAKYPVENVPAGEFVAGVEWREAQLPDREAVRDELSGWPIGSGYYQTSVSNEEAGEMADAVLDLIRNGATK